MIESKLPGPNGWSNKETEFAYTVFNRMEAASRKIPDAGFQPENMRKAFIRDADKSCGSFDARFLLEIIADRINYAEIFLALKYPEIYIDEADWPLYKLRAWQSAQLDSN